MTWANQQFDELETLTREARELLGDIELYGEKNGEIKWKDLHKLFKRIELNVKVSCPLIKEVHGHDKGDGGRIHGKPYPQRIRRI